MKNKNIVLSLLIIGGFFMGCRDESKPKEVTTAPVEFKKEGEVYLTRPSGDTLKHLQIEIADDDYQRETGLMYRNNMNEEEAMLFVFENEQPRGFYMKNTLIPLDIIFLNSDNKIVSITKNAEPESLESIPSDGPAQYVLEVNAGLTERWNLQVGDSLIFRDLR